MAEVRIDGQAHISKIPNTHCRTRMKKKIHTKKEEERRRSSQTSNKEWLEEMAGLWCGFKIQVNFT